MITIYKKDMHNYFSTFSGYLFMACVVLVGGIYCYMYNFYYGYASFEQSINYLPFFFVFLVPVVSAGVFTDEKRQKTEQLLYTLPLTSKDIVLGKYFALLTILFIPLAILGCYPLIMSMYGQVNLVSAYCNLFAIFLLGAALCAICMFISSLTESIIVSAVLCFGGMFVLYQLDGILENLTPSAKNSYIGFILLAVFLAIFIWFMTKNIYIAIIPSAVVVILLNVAYRFSMTLVAGKINLMLSSIAVFSKLNNFMNGIFDVNTTIYYLSIAGLFVLFTVYTFERKRWN
ncbi:MAG: ABC transporter [Firmicutes bacterium]|nr:ABC transporter [Bacillota bacterium]